MCYSYKENVKKLSVLYKDQQHKPLETAIYWTEYILRHKTAQHLNLATRDMNFLQIANLDIILICLLSVFLLLGVTVTCMSCLILKGVSKQTVTEKIKTS
jgi:glucuronosyltransferase